MKKDLLENMEMNARLLRQRKAESAVLIVGHPMVDCSRVENLLQGVGMALARPTRQQELAPADISAHIVKRAGVSPDFSTKIEQIQPAPLWQILALDLFMGNSDASFWGWSDPKSIYLLDYWHAADPDLQFVFVYDSLWQVLLRAMAGQQIKPEFLTRLINEWKVFYDAVIYFYNRHRGRCLLVHSERVCNFPFEFDTELAARLQRPLERSEVFSSAFKSQDPLQNYLAENLVQEQRAWRCVYEELQSLADFPLNQEYSVDVFVAWNDFSDLASSVRQKTAALSETEATLIEVKEKFHANAACEKELATLQNKMKEVERFRKGQQAPVLHLQEENDLLLQQLHRVQEELERYYLENQLLKKSASPDVKHKQEEKNLQLQYGAAEHVKRMLSYRLGAVMIERSRSVAGWLIMPFDLLREARNFEEEKRACGEKTPLPLSKYADAHEGERVKRHLSYRLGATLLSNYKSPVSWLKLPWLMRQQVAEYQRERASKSTC